MRIAPCGMVVLGLVACKNSPVRPDAALDGPQMDAPEAPIDAPDVERGEWFSPKPGEYWDWDLQLHGDLDLSVRRRMYVLDLFDVMPAGRSIDYGDGTVLPIPAGSRPTAIEQLKATAPPTKVVCRIGAGAIELDDPDAHRFPGHGTNPPDRPMDNEPPRSPPSYSVIGWNTRDPNRPKERFLDLREGSRRFWAPFILKRIELAEAVGCDAVYADRVDSLDAGPGWQFTDQDLTTWFAELAAAAHGLKISIGVHSEYLKLDVTDSMGVHFDWTIQERCGETGDCAKLISFTRHEKAAFAVDLVPPVTTGEGVEAEMACARYRASSVDGIVKRETLSGDYVHVCPAPPAP